MSDTTRTPEESAAYFADPHARLNEVVAVFQRWLYLPDPTSLLAALAAVTANCMDGDPCWLLLVGSPSSGKSEIIGSMSRLTFIHWAATLTEASLLSGSPDREKAQGAKGGLLREIGDFGVILAKDFGSIINMQRDTQAVTLAALREVYDGQWTRHVGTNGGKTLHWEGKVGLIGGCTQTIDRQHAVMASMGERFLMSRMPEADAGEQAARALDHVGFEHIMRAELSQSVLELCASADLTPQPMDTADRTRLINLAQLVVRCRSAVERDGYSREIELIPDAEAPGRFVTTLARLLAGLRAIGADPATASRVMRRVALDSMPALRWRIIEALSEGVTVDTTNISLAIGYPTTTTRRALEDLTAHGVVVRESNGSGKADSWHLSDWTLARLAGDEADQTSVPEIPTPINNPHRTNNGKSGKVENEALRHKLADILSRAPALTTETARRFGPEAADSPALRAYVAGNGGAE